MAMYTQLNERKKMDSRWNLIRIFAICLVVYIHSSADLDKAVSESVNPTAFLLCCWHVKQMIHVAVPLFVMLSGALLLGKKEEISVFMAKRVKRVLVPFLIWSPIIYVLCCIKWNMPLHLSSIGDIVWLIMSSGTYSVYWFVYLILSLCLVTPFLRIIVKHVSLKQLAFFCALPLFWHVVGQCAPDVAIAKNWDFPYSVYLFYYVAGYFVRRLLESETMTVCRNAAPYVSVLMIAPLLIMHPDDVGLNVIPASLGTYALLLSFPRSVADAVVAKLSLIDKMSYGIYLTHFVWISLLMRTGIFDGIHASVRGVCLASFVVAVDIAMFGILNKLRVGKWLM